PRHTLGTGLRDVDAADDVWAADAHGDLDVARPKHAELHNVCAACAWRDDGAGTKRSTGAGKPHGGGRRRLESRDWRHRAAGLAGALWDAVGAPDADYDPNGSERRRAADCLRQSGESAAGARDGAAERV